MIKKLSPDQLCLGCEPSSLQLRSIEEVEPVETIVGQQRAVRALTFGLGNKATGFNIYVSGPPGTGKMTAVKSFLEHLAQKEKTPGDWCYVNNFQDPYRPKKLLMPQGQGRGFKNDVDAFIAEAREGLIQTFESEDFSARREEIIKKVDQEKQDLLIQLGEEARQEGFLIKPSPVGAIIVPLKNGQPISEEEAEALTAEEKREITQKQEGLQEKIKDAFRQVRNLDRDANEKLRSLEEEAALFTISPMVEELKEKYKDQSEVIQHLDTVKVDILENLGDFIQSAGEKKQNAMTLPGMAGARPNHKYEVNVLVDNGEKKGAPLVLELNPTYNNLFGRVEHQSMMGTLVTDFTLIRDGSLHRANGGYLVIPVEELLMAPFSYESLKRAIRNREIAIEDAGERLGFLSTKSLKPEPIPLNLQVVLLGSPRIYRLLYNLDSDFKELFKVKAEFDSVMERTEENTSNFIAFISKVSREEDLVPMDSSGIAKMIEYASRLAEDQRKISTRFGEISDVIREASHYARREGSENVSASQVKKALDERVFRSNLIQIKMQELIDEGTIFIDVTETQTGQINGLSVMDLGDVAFGMPNRITASLSLGNKGVIDIEREAKLGGNIHSKGVMILSGYLSSLFGQEQPLSLSVQIVFEQSYGMVEGDSASSTELYAILSALSGLGIKQGIAVTGSVNQKGEVQAIGGVNEKVEGFYEVCRAKGLNGEQGVLIPSANLPNLMLKEEVVKAVEEGTFHLWAVDHIDEGIEVLTGVKAGRRPEGGFEPDSVYDRAQKRLEAMAETIKKFSKGEGNGKSGNGNL